jgi:Tfp pilus assembly protein FimT
MITVLILGLVAVLALPTYGRFVQDWKLNGEADQFAAALRAARSAAVMKNIDVVFTFDMDNNTYSYFEDENGNGVRDNSEYRSAVFELYHGITITAHTFTGTTLTFGSRGNTRDSGSITLRNAYNRNKSIRIFGGTGNIKVD